MWFRSLVVEFNYSQSFSVNLLVNSSLVKTSFGHEKLVIKYCRMIVRLVIIVNFCQINLKGLVLCLFLYLGDSFRAIFLLFYAKSSKFCLV